jgi:hypothetical protein
MQLAAAAPDRKGLATGDEPKFKRGIEFQEIS